jgi:hypothetical protein
MNVTVGVRACDRMPVGQTDLHARDEAFVLVMVSTCHAASSTRELKVDKIALLEAQIIVIPTWRLSK